MPAKDPSPKLTMLRATKVAFLAGGLTASALWLATASFVGYRVGFGVLLENMWTRVLVPSNRVLDLPDSLLKELTALNAVVDNADNPTKQLSHYTILVQRDEDVGWSLIPNARIALYMLRSLKPLNLNPPVLALRSDAVLSEQLRAYIKRQARLSYTYTVGMDGFRMTVPVVRARHRILMVGDSVLFGNGVSDDATMASWLQRMIGDDYQIVNAGVGGFSGEQALRMAIKAAKRDAYDALIYIACQNDFMLSDRLSYSAQAVQVLNKFAEIKERFSGNIIVMLQPYLEYAVDDILQSGGWYHQMVSEMDRLRREMPLAAAGHGFKFIDMTDVIEDHMRQSGSILARFALYVDNAHLSPVGNRLAAERLYEVLRELRNRPPKATLGESSAGLEGHALHETALV
jgi:hypothetical protein